MKQQFPGQRDDEKLILVFRRHILAMRKGLLVAIILIAAGCAPYAISPSNSNLLWVTLGGLVLAIITFLYHWIGWYFTVYIVTDQRVRQDRQKGLFDSLVVEVALDKIHNISVEKRGLMGNVFDYGTIVLQTYVGDLVITMVSNAMAVREKLQKEINQYEGKNSKEQSGQD